MRSTFATAVLVFTVLFAAGAAQARRTGNTFTLASACVGCHSTGEEPTFEVTQVTPDPLQNGGSAIFHIVLTSTRADVTGRMASFAASVPRDSGVFVAGVDTEVCPDAAATCPAGGTENAIRDVDLRPFDPVTKSYAWDIEITGLVPGELVIALGGNDSDGNTFSSGDNNVQEAIRVTVAEGEGEGEGGEGEGEGEGEPPGGCSCVGTKKSMGLVALAPLVLLTFRRRR